MKKSTQSKLMDKIGLGPEERELRLGTSFTNPRECTFHTLRYDFKPASVDTNKMATIDVGSNSQITMSVPPNLIYKGSAKPYQKQCIGIINPETGDFILEKLHSNIQVKKIRSENQKMSAQKLCMIDQYISGHKPKKPSSNKSSKGHSVNSTNVNSSNNSSKSNTSKQQKKNKTEFQPVASNMNNLLHMHKNSPNSQSRFPSSSPLNASPSKTTLDDHSAVDEWLSSLDTNRPSSIKQEVKKPIVKDVTVVKPSQHVDEGEELSDSSSSCSSSSSVNSSDSSSETESQPKKKVRQNELMNNVSPDQDDLLKEDLLKGDLQLSESGSDSD